MLIRIAFQETLEENEKLHKIIEGLKEENNLLKQMLDEANSFVEIVKVYYFLLISFRYSYNYMIIIDFMYCCVISGIGIL